jgi:hypothetical protein
MQGLFGDEIQESRAGSKQGKRPYERVGRYHDTTKRCKHCAYMLEGTYNRDGRYVYCKRFENKRTAYNLEKTRPNYFACSKFEEKK